MGDLMIRIRTFRDEFEAEVAQAELSASGIQSLVFVDGSGGTFATLPVPGGVHLAVRERDEDAAELVLEEITEPEEDYAPGP